MASEFTYGSTSWYDFDCIPLKVRVQENYYLAILSNERVASRWNMAHSGPPYMLNDGEVIGRDNPEPISC